MTDGKLREHSHKILRVNLHPLVHHFVLPQDPKARAGVPVQPVQATDLPSWFHDLGLQHFLKVLYPVICRFQGPKVGSIRRAGASAIGHVLTQAGWA